MATLLTPLLAALFLQAPALTGTVVDDRQAPLADVEVLLSFGMSADGAVPVLDRTRTDAKGAFRFAIPSRKTRQGLGRFADVWAYRPGLAPAPNRSISSRASSRNRCKLSCARPASGP